MKTTLKIIVAILVIATAYYKTQMDTKYYKPITLTNLLEEIQNTEIYQLPKEIEIPKAIENNPIFTFLSPMIKVFNIVANGTLRIVNLIIGVFQFLWIILKWFIGGGIIKAPA